METNEYFDIEIDKLTHSIENRKDGSIYDTEVLQMFAKDMSQIKKAEWHFNWHTEISNRNRRVYKLVICYVAFDAKTALIKHYQETLYATHFKGTKMFIETSAALHLIK